MRSLLGILLLMTAFGCDNSDGFPDRVVNDPCTQGRCVSGLVCDPVTNTCQPVAVDAGPTCVANASICSENNLLRCKADGTEWLVEEVCAGACVDGGCEATDAG